MQYQYDAPPEVLAILDKRDVGYFNVNYYAWPQMFGSTAGPCHGIGGQSMSTFTVQAWVCDDAGPTVYTCAGMYYFEDEPFKPFKTIKNWREIPPTKTN